MFRFSALVLLVAAIAGCSEHETGQVSQGDNKIGSGTTEAVDDQAVELPAVRNTTETTSEVSAGELNQSPR
jgi:hypothetical protein